MERNIVVFRFQFLTWYYLCLFWLGFVLEFFVVIFLRLDSVIPVCLEFTQKCLLVKLWWIFLAMSSDLACYHPRYQWLNLKSGTVNYWGRLHYNPGQANAGLSPAGAGCRMVHLHLVSGPDLKVESEVCHHHCSKCVICLLRFTSRPKLCVLDCRWRTRYEAELRSALILPGTHYPALTAEFFLCVNGPINSNHTVIHVNQK